MLMRFALTTAIVTTLFALLAQGASAGTTGAISGVVTDTRGRPLPGATVTASSPSQTARAITDDFGGYRFVSLAPDAYTVTVRLPGYQTVQQNNVIVFADQVDSVSIPLAQAVAGATMQTRTESALVRPGVTSNLYSISAANAKRLSALSGPGNFDHAYSAMQTIPGVFIPPGQNGWFQILSIRGGDQDQVGYEFDGIPVVRRFDNTPITMLSSLGQQELQVYTGGIPATSEATGISGYVNQVAQQGTSPGFASATLGIGGPAFYHKAQVEVGGVAGALSYYVGTSGVNQTFNYLNQQNGGISSAYFYPYSVPTGPAGVYVGGPTTFVSGSAFGLASLEERESLANFHLSIPHKKGGLKDDLQLLWQNGMELSNFYSSLSDFGGACAVNGCSPYTWQDTYVYSGAMFAPFQASGLTKYDFPSSPAHPFQGTMDPNVRDGTFNDDTIVKLQYQHNFSPQSYLRAYAYSTYSDWFLNGPSSDNQNFGFELADWEPTTHTSGLVGDFFTQLGRANALTLSGSYEKTHAVWYSNASPTPPFCSNPNCFFPISSSDAQITSLIDAKGNCYNYNTGQPWSCFDSLSMGTVTDPEPGAAPRGARWIATDNGYAASVSNNNSAFTAVAANDEWHPNERLVLDYGARMENFAFLFGNTESGYPARAFWFAAYNREYCFGPGLSAPVLRGQNAQGSPGLGACPAGSYPLGTHGNPLLSNQSGGTTSSTVLQPRLAFTYSLGSNDVIRGSWGVYARPPYLNWMQYNTVQQNLASFIGQSFYAYGFNTPEHFLKPDKSLNMDLSWEHAFRHGLAFKITPFLRSTQNQEQIFEINPLTALESGLNVGHQTSYGVELLLQQGSPSDLGFSWALSYTHLHSSIRYNNFAGTNENVIDTINNSIYAYNAYTHTCAANPHDPRCKANTSGGVTAAQCFTPSGQPDASCAPGDVANPYWSQMAQAPLDRNGSYPTYDIFPGPFIGANSFDTTDFGSLVLNYHTRRWTFTPSVTYNGGASYGSPLVWPGYDPLTCKPISAINHAAATSSCTGSLFIPDAYTGQFDSLGMFKQPWRLTGNAQITYVVSPRVSLRLNVANIFDYCGQRGYAWDNAGVCVYSQLPSNILAPVGNFLTPSAAPPQLRAPYAMWNDNLNLAYLGAKLPTQLELDINFRL